jgi:enolase
VEQPHARTKCPSGRSAKMNDQLWEIEQDLKELAKIKGEEP